MEKGKEIGEETKEVKEHNMDTMTDDRTQTRPLAANTATVERTLGRITQVATAGAVFGQPTERGEYTVIPCAKVSLGLGLGSGSGSAPAATAEQGQEGKAQSQGQGEGAGGGGGASGRPIAVIVVSREGVRVRPIVDVTRVVVTSMATASVLALAIAQLGIARRRSQAIRAFALGRLLGRMMPAGRGGGLMALPYPRMKLPSAAQLRRSLKR
jgi:uncharacterized spore protein YtfJ